MPIHTHNDILHHQPKRRMIPLYVAALLLIFHSSVGIYINSSYLEQFIPKTGIGSVYTIGSALTVLLFLFISRVLHKVGNYKLTIGLLILNFLAVLGMAYADTLREAVPLFLIHLITLSVIFFNIDVFMEEQIGNNETATGSKRGLLLTLSSLIAATTPLLSTKILDYFNGDFTNVYILSSAIIVPIIAVMMFFFKDFSDPQYNEIDLFKAIGTFWRQTSIRSVFIANFSLNMFFVAMVVYTPLYLVNDIGLSWSEFGVIMFLAQLAYVFLEYPIGIIADKYIGEKEMMGFGFLIIIVSTTWISFVTAPSVLIWSIIMFTTRVGASLVEVTTESYFFKQTKSNDAQVISFFRITRPLSYVVGALLASLALLYLPFNLLFIGVALLMIPAMFGTMSIIDSK